MDNNDKVDKENNNNELDRVNNNEVEESFRIE